MLRPLIVSASFCFAITSHAQTLSLERAVQLAAQNQPDADIQTAAVAAATAAARSAGRLPDPTLMIGVDNVPLNGEDRWSLGRDFMTMRKVGLAQEIPNSARRHAQKEISDAAVASARAEQRLRLLEIRRDTALAWLRRYYGERRLALLDESDRENRLLDDVIRAQVRAGRASAADGLGPRQEALELADRRDQLTADLASAMAGLRRWVGIAADESLDGAAPDLHVEPAALRGHVHRHPELAVYGPQIEMARAEIREAAAAKRPDLSIELAYGRRGAPFSDMVSLQFKWGLPIFASRRQDPQIDSKRESLTRISAEREAMLRDHTRDLDAELAQFEAEAHQLERMRSTRLSLAQQKVDFGLAAYRAGQQPLATVLAARRELIELKLQQVDLQAKHAETAARLYFIYGEGAQ